MSDSTLTTTEVPETGSLFFTCREIRLRGDVIINIERNGAGFKILSRKHGRKRINIPLWQKMIVL